MIRMLLLLAAVLAISPLSTVAAQQNQDQPPPKPPAQQEQQGPQAKEPPPLSPGESSSAKPQVSDSEDPNPASPGASQPKTDAAKNGAQPDGRPVAKPGVLPPEDSPAWDPFHAEQDIEVGTYYMHKGDMDAAIARFEDAIQLKPNFAKPRLLLAEIYEKKHDKQNALQYYKEYLKVFPNASDAQKIRKKIEKLSNE
jgi:tetratricopeptide (TPR) repeat protein